MNQNENLENSPTRGAMGGVPDEQTPAIERGGRYTGNTPDPDRKSEHAQEASGGEASSDAHDESN